MTNAQITLATEIATAVTLAVVTALSTEAPVQEAPTTPKAPKAPKAPKKAPRRTKAENSHLVKRINGRIANATKATTAGATYEEMIAVLKTATAITPTGWVSTHNQIARKAEKLAAVIAAR